MGISRQGERLAESMEEKNSNGAPKTLPQTDVVLEAERLLHFSSERGVTLRLIGGLGVWFSSPSALKPTYARKYNDLDFVAHRKQSEKIQKFFVEMGYSPRELFNKLQGDQRLMFNDTKNERRVDIFLDSFVMCHRFDFKDRLELCEKTLSPSDLLLTKLQIFEINKKDITDAVTLVLDNPLSEDPRACQKIQTKRVAEACSDDWGTYKTTTMNIEKIVHIVPELNIPEADTLAVKERLLSLRKSIEDIPKSFRWKMRARVGEKVKWYELPETTN